MKNYGYLDKGNMLHVVAEEETAKQYTKNGKYKETDLESEMGYPVEKGERLVVYGLGEAYIKGNAGDGEQVSLNSYPKTLKLYKDLV